MHGTLMQRIVNEPGMAPVLLCKALGTVCSETLYTATVHMV